MTQPALIQLVYCPITKKKQIKYTIKRRFLPKFNWEQKSRERGNNRHEAKSKGSEQERKAFYFSTSGLIINRKLQTTNRKLFELKVQIGTLYYHCAKRSWLAK